MTETSSTLDGLYFVQWLPFGDTPARFVFQSNSLWPNLVGRILGTPAPGWVHVDIFATYDADGREAPVVVHTDDDEPVSRYSAVVPVEAVADCQLFWSARPAVRAYEDASQHHHEATKARIAS